MLRQSLLLSMLLLTIIFAGCGADKEIRGPLFLEAAPPPKEAKEFKTGPKGEVIFETPDIRFSLTPLRNARSSDPKLIQSLVADGFVIIDIEITNITESDKVRFNPAMSDLQDDKGSYKKPLEYTALYEVAMHKEMERTLNRELKGRFFDTNQTVYAGKRIKKLLIFTPFIKDGEEAQLTFQEVYIGNETIHITFPFKLTPEEKTE